MKSLAGYNKITCLGEKFDQGNIWEVAITKR